MSGLFGVVNVQVLPDLEGNGDIHRGLPRWDGGYSLICGTEYRKYFRLLETDREPTCISCNAGCGWQADPEGEAAIDEEDWEDWEGAGRTAADDLRLAHPNATTRDAPSPIPQTTAARTLPAASPVRCRTATGKRGICRTRGGSMRLLDVRPLEKPHVDHVDTELYNRRRAMVTPACVPGWVKEAWTLRQERLDAAERAEEEGIRAAGEIAVRDLCEVLNRCLPDALNVADWIYMASRSDRNSQVFSATAGAVVDLGDGIQVKIIGPVGPADQVRLSSPEEWDLTSSMVFARREDLALALLEWYTHRVKEREKARKREEEREARRRENEARNASSKAFHQAADAILTSAFDRLHCLAHQVDGSECSPGCVAGPYWAWQTLHMEAPDPSASTWWDTPDLDAFEQVVSACIERAKANGAALLRLQERKKASATLPCDRTVYQVTYPAGSCDSYEEGIVEYERLISLSDHPNSRGFWWIIRGDEVRPTLLQLNGPGTLVVEELHFPAGTPTTKLPTPCLVFEKLQDGGMTLSVSRPSVALLEA